jgi:hypothetical protein
MLARFFYQWESRLARRDTNRRKHPFDWGLGFVPDGIAATDPKLYLFEYARQAIARSEDYHSHKPVSDYHIEDNHLTFSSPLPSIYPHNNVVHGRHFPTESRGRVVVVLPQWNADANGHMSLCRLLNHYGLSALRLSLPYHDLRMPADLMRADYMLSANIGRTLQAIRQAVIDSRAAIDWLQSQGYTRFGILGTSIGSCVALITLANDPRLSLSVQNHVSPYFADVVWEGISTRHVRASLEGNIALEDLRQIWMPISPKAYFPRLAGTGRACLLVHALYDYSFPHRLSLEVLKDYENLRIPHSVFKLFCGHYTSGEFPFNIILGCAMCNYLRKNL